MSHAVPPRSPRLTSTGAGAMTLGCILLLTGGLVPGSVEAQSPVQLLLDDTRAHLEAQFRYEFVDQADLDRDAHAGTFRARFGFETGDLQGLSLLMEGDFTTTLLEDFNSTVNQKTDRPVVADPDSERLNRLALRYEAPTSLPLLGATEATLGRQRIIHDHARFIGNVGFRQNEQTFDAFRAVVTPTEGVAVDYSYIWQVNRIFGSDSPVGRENADSHLLRAAVQSPLGTLSGHAYLVDLKDALMTSSTQTYGVRFNGQRSLGSEWMARYAAAYSTQRAYGANTLSFSHEYWEVEGGLAWHGLSASVAMEILDGDGSTAFRTPLATLHAFQGFADVFLTTPSAGLQDLRLALGYELPDSPLGPVRLSARYHDFSPRTGSQELGREVNLGAFVTLASGVRLSVEYADFFGADEPLPDTRKLWLALAL